MHTEKLKPVAEIKKEIETANSLEEILARYGNDCRKGYKISSRKPSGREKS